MVTSYVRVVLLLGLASVCATNVVANPSCARLSCDCASLPSDAFQRVCQANEAALKAQCSAKGKLTQRCVLHGLSAFPVAISTKFSSVQESQAVKSDARKAKDLLWSVQQDANILLELVQKGNIDTGAQILKLTKNRLVDLFEVQKSLNTRYADNDKKFKKAWRDYAPENLALAVHWQQALRKLEAQLKQDSAAGKVGPQQKILIRAYLLTGQLFEHAGLSNESAGTYDEAARAWQAAADSSASLVASLVNLGLSGKKLDKYRALTAARFYRAAALWLRLGEQAEVMSMLTKAQAYKGMPELISAYTLETKGSDN